MMPNTTPNPDFDTDFSMDRESILSEQLSCGTTVSGTDDISLLERIRQGDQAAMAELFDRHGRAVFSVAVHILKDDGHAEDVMQEIFFQIWQNSDSFVQTLGSLRTWLAAIARNRSIDVLRRRKPTDPVEKVILASRCNLVSEAEHNAMIEKVLKAMKELPEAQQEAMNLAFFQDLSHAEVAQRTGEPLGTIKTRIRLALIALRKALVA
jgi:RNA polymerase sigma-70 factor (ECF subfamily)